MNLKLPATALLSITLLCGSAFSVLAADNTDLNGIGKPTVQQSVVTEPPPASNGVAPQVKTPSQQITSDDKARAKAVGHCLITQD